MNRATRRAAIRPRLLRRTEGGCDDCTAYTDLVAHGHGLYVLEVRHDDTCPAFRALQARHNERKNR